LLLDGLGGEADFPAHVAHVLGAAAAHERELDAIRVVEVKAIRPRRREVHAPPARRPELLDGLGQRRTIEAHATCSGVSSTAPPGPISARPRTRSPLPSAVTRPSTPRAVTISVSTLR